MEQMTHTEQNRHSPTRQAWHFIQHLRWHYQLLILSGGFLLGGFLSDQLNAQSFILQFLNVHLLLFGGATAYNSYWDKDKGPVGGLRNPPPMEKWMWHASIYLQLIGFLLALQAGSYFAMVYAVSMLLFWLYSSPLARWKGAPVKSLAAIGISTGANGLFMGYLAAGSPAISPVALVAGLGTALVMLSLYPVSQLYQLDEDIERGDQTFAALYGFLGVYRFFLGAYYGGVLLISLAIAESYAWTGGVFLLLGGGTGLWIRRMIKNLKMEIADYGRIMKIKFGTSLAFVVFLMAVLLIKHS